MYTECPSCNKQHPLTVKKLRLSQGKFLCNRCYTTFDPLELLGERSLFKKKDVIKSESELENLAAPSSKYWMYGLVCCVVIFILQVFLFKADTMVQNKTLRPWLETICSVINYPLTPYKNSNEFTVLNVSFDPSGKDTYVLKASLLNQSEFSQNQPSIKLALMNFVGEVFAERIFHPQHYSINKTTQIKPDMPTEIKMIIAAPSTKVGGYRFELI